MNTIPIYILGIALGFALGLIVMMLRGKNQASTEVLPDQFETLEVIPPAEEHPDEMVHAEAILTEGEIATIPADHWLEEMEYAMDHKSHPKTKSAEALDNEGIEEIEEIPDFDTPEAVWLNGLRKTHETVSKSSNSSHETLPIVFDSSDPKSPQDLV